MLGVTEPVCPVATHHERALQRLAHLVVDARLDKFERVLARRRSETTEFYRTKLRPGLSDEARKLHAETLLIDGHNDLPAIEAVGWGVAMGNAEPEVVAAARLLVADVEDDGAAQAIDAAAGLGPPPTAGSLRPWPIGSS